MTAGQTRDRGDIVPVLVAFDDHREFALGLHKAILSPLLGGFPVGSASLPGSRFCKTAKMEHSAGQNVNSLGSSSFAPIQGRSHKL
jgi:hypothetical protein